MNHRLLVVLVLAGCTATVQTQPAQPMPPPPPPSGTVVVAGPPAKHPSYLRALTDLRSARAHLERPAGVMVKWDEKRAVGEIEAAIREIKQASIDDGKNLNDHPIVDVGMVWGDRLHKSLELVEAARRDVNEEEDNAFANGLKNRAIGHIDLAARDIEQGVADAGARVAVVVAAPPPPPSKHPAYIKALSDLRASRSFLERPSGIVVKWDEKKAVREIDGALREIKEAAIDDGKNIDDHPAVDQPTWGGRLQRALELLERARADVGEEEDNPGVHKLRMAAIRRIDAAEKFVREGMEDARSLKEVAGPPPGPPIGGGEGAHPAYLHALTDLRASRSLLERPAKPDVKWDENNGIREIDAAIKEIKEAAIDDGKPMSDHPPIDAHLAHRDRLKQAMELLHKSAHDIEEREDDKWAKGLRARALGHIRNAEQAVRGAIEERKDDRRHP